MTAPGSVGSALQDPAFRDAKPGTSKLSARRILCDVHNIRQIPSISYHPKSEPSLLMWVVSR